MSLLSRGQRSKPFGASTFLTGACACSSWMRLNESKLWFALNWPITTRINSAHLPMRTIRRRFRIFNRFNTWNLPKRVEEEILRSREPFVFAPAKREVREHATLFYQRGWRRRSCHSEQAGLNVDVRQHAGFSSGNPHAPPIDAAARTDAY